MLIAQFGSKLAQGNRPLWLASIADLQIDEGPTAKRAWTAMPWSDFGADGYGSFRAPLETGTTSVRGLIYCNQRNTLAEFERNVRRYVGVKDWLIGYRYNACKCGYCGDYLRCCHVCGSERTVQWFAQRARLQQISVQKRVSVSSSEASGTREVRMDFEADTPWQLLESSRWAWGVPDALYRPIDQWDTGYNACDAPDVVDLHWPCVMAPCTPEPPYRFYRRIFSSWMQTYCVGYWTAGRWIRGAIPSDAVLHVAGDTHPMVRLAFTNFTRLTVTICSPLGYECSFSLEGPVGEPQYVLVSPQIGAEARYCPIQDDECLDNVPAEYTDLAINGSRFPITSQTCPIAGQLWPGRNKISFSGFRLPVHPFHWSYDMVPQFI